VVLGVHLFYLSLNGVEEDSGENGGMPAIFPLVFFGFGHALFTTVQGPVVPTLVSDKSKISSTFNLIKITESLGITVFTWLAGYIRQSTGSFDGVLVMLCMCCCISLAACNRLMKLSNEQDSANFTVTQLIAHLKSKVVGVEKAAEPLKEIK